MIPWYWSWLLATIGVTGLWLAGSKKTAGWVIGIGVQVLWITYGISTEQLGFVVMALAYGTVNIRNLIKWRRERPASGFLVRAHEWDDEALRRFRAEMDRAAERHTGRPFLIRPPEPQAGEGVERDPVGPACRFPSCGRGCMQRCPS